MKDKHESNRKAWNEAAEFYRRTIEHDVSFLKSGKHTFFDPELRVLRPLLKSGETCVHLQCAGGSDTLSFLNLGAKKVIGVDISEKMIEVAQTKSKQLGAQAEWVRSDVLEVSNELNGLADLVYTGKGAINWVMDLERWAHVIARVLRPGGHFYLFEGHPFTYFFEMTATELKLDPAHQGYFSKIPVESQDWPETYVGKLKDSTSEQSKKFERAWPVSEVINALIGAGFVLKYFGEHPEKYWEEFPNLQEEVRQRFPNTFSILAQKPF